MQVRSTHPSLLSSVEKSDSECRAVGNRNLFFRVAVTTRRACDTKKKKRARAKSREQEAIFYTSAVATYNQRALSRLERPTPMGSW